MGNQSTKSQNVNRNARPKKNVHWKSAEPPSAPGKPMQVAVFDGSTEALAIRWECPYTDGGSPIIGYLVEQRRVGSPSWVKTSATLIPYPELTLTGIDPTWRYQFRVFAQNVVGLSESSPVSDPISAITQRGGATAPQFLNELQNATVLENDQCEFHVSVIGSPTPQINWFKDGFEIFSSRRTKILNDHGSSTLIFHQVALTDEGEIKCTATNRYGHVVTRFQLRIDAPPKIRLPRQYEDGYLVEAGEVIKLKVGIAGRPTPAISWSHNGEIINNSTRCEITSNDKNSFLKITKATRKDRGEYNVRAINKLGEFNSSFLVTVTAKPSPPQNVRIAMTLGKSVTLSWNEPEDDGGCKIGNYVVEYYRLGWDVWLKASSTRQLTATLNDLIEGSEYKFRVKAESPYGLSEPSDESKILFVPDPKRGIVTPMSDRRPRTTTQTTLSPQTERKSTIDNRINKSPIRQIIIPEVPKNVEFISQIYDNEQIVKELNYGTSVDDHTKKKETISNARQKSQLNSIQSVQSNVNKANTVKPDPRSSIPKESFQGNNMLYESHEQAGHDKNKLTPAHDQVHSSNEYMLVLYDDKKTTKTSDEKDHFDLDLKEAIEAPPLSLSTPDLHDISAHHNPFQPLRRSASSSELLYEKVMQRFYQAVELDEAEMARKRGDSVEPTSKKKFKSIEEPNDRNEFVSAGAANNQMPQDKSEIEPDIESDQSNDWQYENDRDLRKEILESQQKRSYTPHELQSDDIDYDDDYTESTASTASNSVSASNESIEQFINSVRSATTNATTTTTTNPRQAVNDELETYHPRMEVRALSPYRTPEPGQATVILNKPVPLPDPDIKPKSILKRRTSNENNVNDVSLNTALAKDIEREAPVSPQPLPLTQQLQQQQQQQQQPSQQQIQIQSQAKLSSPPPPQPPQSLQPQPPQPSQPLQPQPKSLPSTPKPEKEKRSFLNLFSKKTTSTENLKKPVEPVIEKKVPEKAVEKEKLKKRQDSIEENKVEQVAVIDHYSDIVREMGSRPASRPPSRTSHVPLYMNNQAMREAAARAEQEDRELNAQQQKDQAQYASSEVNKMNINEDLDAQFMMEVAKKMNLYTESNEKNEPELIPPSSPSSSSLPQSDFVEISVEHTKSVSYAVRQIKQPDVVYGMNNAVGSVFQANAKSLTESTKLCSDGDGDGNNSVIDTKKQDTLIKVRSSSRPLGRKSISEQRQRSQSKSPVSQRKTSLSSTVLKVTRMPIETANNDIDIDLQPNSQSPSPEPRCKTPDQLQDEAETELNVRSTLNFTINMVMFVMACWLYVFYDARFAIPFLGVMVYRYVRDLIVSNWQKWTKRKNE